MAGPAAKITKFFQRTAGRVRGSAGRRDPGVAAGNAAGGSRPSGGGLVSTLKIKFLGRFIKPKKAEGHANGKRDGTVVSKKVKGTRSDDSSSVLKAQDASKNSSGLSPPKGKAKAAHESPSQSKKGTPNAASSKRSSDLSPVKGKAKAAHESPSQSKKGTPDDASSKRSSDLSPAKGKANAAKASPSPSKKGTPNDASPPVPKSGSKSPPKPKAKAPNASPVKPTSPPKDGWYETISDATDKAERVVNLGRRIQEVSLQAIGVIGGLWLTVNAFKHKATELLHQAKDAFQVPRVNNQPGEVDEEAEESNSKEKVGDEAGDKESNSKEKVEIPSDKK